MKTMKNTFGDLEVETGPAKDGYDTITWRWDGSGSRVKRRVVHSTTAKMAKAMHIRECAEIENMMMRLPRISYAENQPR